MTEQTAVQVIVASCGFRSKGNFGTWLIRKGHVLTSSETDAVDHLFHEWDHCFSREK